MYFLTKEVNQDGLPNYVYCYTMNRSRFREEMSGIMVLTLTYTRDFNNWHLSAQSRAQSLRSPWPVVGKRELWKQPFWNKKGNNRILPIRFHCAVCLYGACLKWLLPELSFSDSWSRGTKTLGTRLLSAPLHLVTHAPLTFSEANLHTCFNGLNSVMPRKTKFGEKASVILMN